MNEVRITPTPMITNVKIQRKKNSLFQIIMATANQLQRITLDKNFFWHGVLMFNENGGHTFFDVRTKKSVPGSPQMIGLYTNDIPPFPLSSTDTLTCTFVLENNMGLTTQRHSICEGSLPGSELQKAIEAQGNAADVLLVNTDTGEWQFQMLNDKSWVLRAVILYVAQATLKELIKDL